MANTCLTAGHPRPRVSARLRGMEKHFEEEAGRWLAWARTPDHDAYWYWRDCFFDAIVAAPGRRTLEIGCGEGRVARDLAHRGHQVVGCELVPTLIRAAADAGGASFGRVNTARLSFPAASFDRTVAYNVLIDVDDLAAVNQETARVLSRAESSALAFLSLWLTVDASVPPTRAPASLSLARILRQDRSRRAVRG
jgi:ubiquinone/menaquinone biosynthesis C-methylase UbiE